MYKLKYFLSQESDFDGISKTQTILNAKFRFGEEVAPKDKEEILKRIDALRYLGTNSSAYFLNHEKMEGYTYGFTPRRVMIFERDKKGLGRKMTIQRKFKKIGFDIDVTSKINLPLEQMLDLDSLNNFILTGKY